MALNFPINPVVGTVYSYAGRTFRWDGVQWTATVAPNATYAPVLISASEPRDPLNGALWFNTLNNNLYTWIQSLSGWKIVSEGETPESSPVTVSVSPPPTSLQGALWYNPTTSDLSIRYNDIDSGQWISVVSYPSEGITEAGGILYGPIFGQYPIPNNNDAFITIGWFNDNTEGFVDLGSDQTITGNKSFTGEVDLGPEATGDTPDPQDNSRKLATTEFVNSLLGSNYQPLSTNLTLLSANAPGFYLNRSNHTGTQAAGTITGLSAVAISGNYADLAGSPSLGSAAARDVPALGNAGPSQVVLGSDTRLGSTSPSWSTIIDTPTTLSGYGITDGVTASFANASFQPLSSNLSSLSANNSAFYLNRANHSGTQSVSTITGLATVATSGSYLDLSGLPTLGTSSPLDVAPTGNASSSQVVKGDDTRLSDSRTPTAHNQAWSTITGTPTTLSGYGISDAITAAAVASSYQPLSSNLTSLGANDANFYLNRTNHTGTQSAGTITGLATVATSGSYLDLSARPTLGNSAALNVGTGAGTVAAGDDSRITGALSAAAAATTYQPLDSDLSSIAALTTTTYGRSQLFLADSAADTAQLELFTSALKGLVPASGGGTTNFLRADGTWVAPPGGGGGGITNLGIGSVTGTSLEVTSDTGTDATIPSATQTEAGLLSASDKVKLDESTTLAIAAALAISLGRR
jgi:hypothetical protein